MDDISRTGLTESEILRIQEILDGNAKADSDLERLLDACYVFGLNGYPFARLLLSISDEYHSFTAVEHKYMELGYAKGQEIFLDEQKKIRDNVINRTTH